MVLRRFAIGILLTTGAFAQMSSFPKGSYFRETFGKPDTKVILQPPARLSEFVRGGKLELSLKDYLALVMANNTQVATTYLTLETSRNNITSAYGAFDPTGSASFTPSFSRKDPKPSTWVGDPSYYHVHSDNFPVSLGWSQKFESGQSISLTGGGGHAAAAPEPRYVYNSHRDHVGAESLQGLGV